MFDVALALSKTGKQANAMTLDARYAFDIRLMQNSEARSKLNVRHKIKTSSVK